MRTYRVAIVGLGRMASTIDDEGHWPPSYSVPEGGKISIAGTCAASDRLELVAGADILPEKRDAFGQRWGISALYDDYLEMIEKERPDMVAVLTNGPLHAEMGTAVANAGVPMLYLEKAIGGSMREADSVLEACRAHGTVLNTGVLRRFDNRYSVIKDAIAGGEIGEPRAAVFYGESPLLHNHIHTIDTISFLIGDPGIEAVRGQLHPRDQKFENNRLEFDPPATYEMVYSNGVEAWTIPVGPGDYEVFGTRGSIKSLNNGVTIAIRKPREAGEGGGKWARTWDEATPPAVELKSAVQAILEDLVDAHESGRPSLGNIELTHRVTEACMAVAESHKRDGAWIRFPLEERDTYIVHR